MHHRDRHRADREILLSHEGVNPDGSATVKVRPPLHESVGSRRVGTGLSWLRSPRSEPFSQSLQPLRDRHLWLVPEVALRGCDVVAIRVEDVAAGGYTADRATVRQKKTGRPGRFELSEQTRQAVDDYLKAANKRPGEFLFAGRRSPGNCMTTRQYARLVSEWIGGVGLDPRLFGTHSLRRTKATLIYRRTGNLRAVQLLLGHTKIESTVRYLGIEVDDALAIAEQVDV